MGLERERVATWLDRYSHAWESYDADAVGELFSEDATYRYHPWDEPLRGRAAIVASWVGDQDPPGTYEGRYQPLASGIPRASVATERFSACLRRSTGLGPATCPPQGALVMQPSTARCSISKPTAGRRRPAPHGAVARRRRR
jgi:hypothetical protein